MRIWIKGHRRAGLALFRKYRHPETAEAAEARVNAIDAYNAAIAKRIYNAITSGTALYAHQLYNHGYTRQVIHQSSRGDHLQITHLCKINGEWTPTSHQDAYSARDIDRALICGQYVNIVTA